MKKKTLAFLSVLALFSFNSGHAAPLTAAATGSGAQDSVDTTKNTAALTTCGCVVAGLAVVALCSLANTEGCHCHCHCHSE